MKRIFRIAVIIVICVVLVFLLTRIVPVSSKKEEKIPQVVVAEENIPEYPITEYAEVAKTEKLTMFADEKGQFTVKNNQTGYAWHSHPDESKTAKKTIGINRRNFQSEVVVNYVYLNEDGKTSSYTEASANSFNLIPNGWVKCEKIKNGIKVTYDFYSICARICVSYTLQGNSLVANIIGNETLESTAFRKAVKNTLTSEQKEVMQDSYITSIWVLPTFGAGSSEETGFVFVPDGCGAYMDFKPLSHTTEITTIPVYGDELSIDEYGVKNTETQSVVRGTQAYLPVFAGAKGTNGYLAEITKGDAAASVNAYKAGTMSAYTGASAQLNLRKVTYATIGGRTVQGIAEPFDRIPDFEITYDFVTKKDLQISDFAALLREKWEASGQIKRQRYEPSLSLKVIGAVDVAAHTLGVPTRKIKALTTFDHANGMVKSLKEDSVDSLAIQYVGWSNSGVQNAKVPKDAKPIGALGNIKDLERITRSGSALYLDIDFITFQKNGNGISKNKNSVKTAFDKPVQIREFSYSTFEYEKIGKYLLSPEKISGVFEKVSKSFGKIPSGIGASFGQMSNVCYSNFGKNAVSRIQTKKYFCEVFSKWDRSMAADSANAYVFPFVQRIFNTPISSGRQSIYDGEIPFYQMLLHGYAAMTGPYLNRCATQDVAFLKTVETGCEPGFMAMYEDATLLNDTDYDIYYGNTFELLKSDMVKIYQRYQALLGKISSERITDHRMHRDDIAETVYENGIRVFVNYSDEDFLIENVTVPAHDFAYIGG